MAIADAQAMFRVICDWTGTERANAVAQLTQLLAIEAELDVMPAGSAAKLQVQQEIAAVRRRYVQNMARAKTMFLACFAYWGTQLTTPSEHVDALSVRDREGLMLDINAQMVSDDHDVGSRARTWAAEPSADDDGIIDRLTVDENGITIEGGYSATIDAVVDSIPAEWRSVLRIRGRNSGEDVLDLKGPKGFIDIEAVNGAGGNNLVSNPNLTNANTSTDEGDVTSLQQWALAGSATHKWDTDIVFRGNAGSHKLYGNGNYREFSQPLIVAAADQRTPRNYKVAVYKTGTPVGNLIVTWGGKSQTWALGSLSAGWNYLRLDRDQDLFPKNFASAGMQLKVKIEFTSGSDASNYANLCFVGGQNLRRFNAAWYGHWSRTGKATLKAKKSFADTDDAGGKNQSALQYAFEDSPDRDVFYLRHVGDGSETIADYS
jgi:hypothetical protein